MNTGAGSLARQRNWPPARKVLETLVFNCWIIIRLSFDSLRSLRTVRLAACGERTRSEAECESNRRGARVVESARLESV